MQKIPSEFIEPYLTKFLMSKLESLHYGLITVERFKSDLMGVDSFIGMFGGIHSSITTSNLYYGLCRNSDDRIIEIANETFELLGQLVMVGATNKALDSFNFQMSK
jgi:hypothetical protein